jgi:hypothetical protein
MRKLLDGTVAQELKKTKTLTIKTKCPGKWILVDKETGEVYTPYETDGLSQWKKIATWDKDGNDAGY